MTTPLLTETADSCHGRVSSDKATFTLVLTGRLDMNPTGRFWRKTQGVLMQVHPIRIVIDMSRVISCDGAGIAFIVKLPQHQATTGGELTLVGLPDEFCRLLDIFGLVIPQPSQHPRHAVSTL